MSEQPGSDDRRTSAFELIKTLLNGIMVDCCARHYDCETQEHQLSSRLAEAIERVLNGLQVNGLQVRVAVQELSDRGPSSRERRVGADLYISIVIDSGHETISKGMLVQAKWDNALAAPAERTRLSEQSKRMLHRTNESYVWVYEPHGIAVIPASRTTEPAADSALTSEARTVGDLFFDGLNCTAGDPAIGLDPSAPIVESLNSMLRELSIGKGLSFVVTG
jgi:hypothetical protein